MSNQIEQYQTETLLQLLTILLDRFDIVHFYLRFKLNVVVKNLTLERH